MSSHILPIRNKLVEAWGSKPLASQALPGISHALAAAGAGGERRLESIDAQFVLNESFDAFRGVRNSGQGALLLAGVQMLGEHPEITAGMFTFGEDHDSQPDEPRVNRLQAYGMLRMRPSDCRSGNGSDPRLNLEYTMYESGHAYVWGEVETPANEDAMLGDYGRLGDAWEALSLNGLESLPDMQERSGSWTAPLRARIGSLAAPQQIGVGQINAFTELVAKLHRGEDAVPDTYEGTIIMDDSAVDGLLEAIQMLKEFQEGTQENN